MGEAHTPSRMGYGSDGLVVVGVSHSRDQACRIRWQTCQEAIIRWLGPLPGLCILIPKHSTPIRSCTRFVRDQLKVERSRPGLR